MSVPSVQEAAEALMLEIEGHLSWPEFAKAREIITRALLERDRAIHREGFDAGIAVNEACHLTRRDER